MCSQQCLPDSEGYTIYTDLQTKQNIMLRKPATLHLILYTLSEIGTCTISHYLWQNYIPSKRWLEMVCCMTLGASNIYIPVYGCTIYLFTELPSLCPILSCFFFLDIINICKLFFPCTVCSLRERNWLHLSSLSLAVFLVNVRIEPCFLL